MKIIQQSACKLIELIRSKELSSQEVTQAFLDRIDEVNPKINAVVQIDEQATLAVAKVLENKEIHSPL